MDTNVIIQGDCIDEMKKLPENSIDAIITDPPYGIGFMGKEWDNFKPKEIKKLKKLIYKTDYIKGVAVKRKKPEWVTRDSGARVAGTYDKTISGAKKFQDFCKEWSNEALRILKPGGHMLVSCSTRMYHRMTVGIEDAGFEIRDTIMWLYGSGFPKSLNIGKQIDKRKDWKKYEEFSEKLKEKREELKLTKQQAFIKCNFKAKTFGGNSWFEHGRLPMKEDYKLLKEGLNLDSTFDILFEEVEREFIKQDKNWGEKGSVPLTGYKEFEVTKGNSEWEGWGTALKPAVEPIVVARKPLSEKNVALNVLKWGTGGINIDECRVGTEDNLNGGAYSKGEHKWACEEHKWGHKRQEGNYVQPQGRFPANIILDEEAGKILDEQSGECNQGHWSKTTTKGFGDFGGGSSTYEGVGVKDKTKHGASRFFYCAKASKSERNFGCEEVEPKQQDESRKEGNPGGDNPRNRGLKERINNHPTVKPIKLMKYLVKLVSRKGAIILDPFLGSGTTAVACLKTGREFIGIEKEEEYIKIAEARIKPYLSQRTLLEF